MALLLNALQISIDLPAGDAELLSQLIDGNAPAG
jgi:hypothetical protein